MARAEPGRLGGDFGIQIDDFDGEPVECVFYDLYRGVALSGRPDEAFSEGRRCHCDLVSVFQGSGQRCAGSAVVSIVGVEKPDYDASIEVG